MIRYKIGLALSGGSIKGFAHLGVLQYMDEIGLKPDIIAGTSAGAIMGAFYADGYSPKEIFEIFSSVGFRGMTSLLPKRGGMFSTKNFMERLKTYLHHQNIEELPIPLRIVATDLDNGCQHVFSEGALAERIMASCSVPVLFQPVVIDRVSYVDGGLFRNLPVTVIREECDKVIGVNLGPETFRRYKKTIRGVAERSWQLVFRQNTRIDKEACDLLLETFKVMKFGMFEVSSAAEIMALGYRMAQRSGMEHFLPIQLPSE